MELNSTSMNISSNESKIWNPCYEISCAPFVVIEVIITVATILSNSIVIIVFSKSKWLQTSITVAIFGLAMTDLTKGLSSMPYNILGAYLTKMYPELEFLDSDRNFCIGRLFLLGVTFGASLFTNVLISVECYRASFKKYYVGDSFGKRRIIISIVCIWVYAVAINLPPFLGWNDWAPGVDCRANLVIPKFVRYVIVPHLPICIIITVSLFTAIYRRISRKVGHFDAATAAAKGNTTLPNQSPPRAVNGANDDTFAQPGTSKSEYTAPAHTRDKLTGVERGEIASNKVCRTGKGKGIGKSSARLAMDSATRQGAAKNANALKASPAIGGTFRGKTAASTTAAGQVCPPMVRLHKVTKNDEMTKTRNVLSVNHRNKTVRAQPTSADLRQSVEKNIFKMSCIVCLCFISLYLPFFIITYCEKFFIENSIFFYIIRNIGVTLMSLSSTINPFIYVIMYRKFRIAFCKVFSCSS